VEDVVDLGDEVSVRVDDIDPQGKVSLSLLGDDSDAPEPAYAAAPSRPSRPPATGNGAEAVVASAAPAPLGDVVSFEDTWEEEAKAEFGDLGPADAAAPGGPPRPDRGPRRNPRRRR
jgi:polyribonucleotide nucleotidyltransferase